MKVGTASARADTNLQGGDASGAPIKSALFHDYFAIRGGGERLVLTLAGASGECTVITGYRTADSYEQASFPARMLDLGLPAAFRGSGFRLPALAWLFRRRRKWASSFPVRVFSGVAAPLAAPGAEGINIFYCHTPPRFLYDQRAHFLSRLTGPNRLAAPLVMALFKRGYLDAVGRMDVIVANSENTRARIKRYLGRESVVVHPPVDTDRFVWQGQGDYYLSTARLTPLKRVDRIVEAFLAMPDKRLVVTSGGEELDRLKAMAAGAPNIEFRGWVSDEELIELVGNAIATVYLPTDEDFGMSPVESMAAGKPVIGVAEGGLVETILPDRTGTLLPPEFTVPDIVKAVTSMTPERAAAMREDCQARAQDFSRERFIAGMHEVIERALQQDRDKA